MTRNPVGAIVAGLEGHRGFRGQRFRGRSAGNHRVPGGHPPIDASQPGGHSSVRVRQPRIPAGDGSFATVPGHWSSPLVV